MALPVFTFCPEFGAREARSPRTSPFKFGNGKERRYRFGLVTDLRTWELSFAYKSNAEREEILAFLEDRGAWKAFEWTDPKGYSARWRCKKWRTTWNGTLQQTIDCTFTELDERVATPVEPPASVPVDMWLSRVTTPLQRAIDGAATLTSDGGSYQTAWVEEQADVGLFDLYVIRRNKEGVVQWQRKLSNCALTDKNQQVPHVCTNGVDLYLLHYGAGTTTGYWVGHGNKETLYAQKINADGSLAWQKQYFVGDGIGTFPGNFEIKGAVYDPISQNIKVAGILAPIFASKSRLFLFSLALSDGAVLNFAPFENVIQVTSTTFNELARLNIQIRNGRVVLSTGSGSANLISWIGEFSLDLSTIFAGYRFSGFDLGLIYPASDGGFYGLNNVGQSTTSNATICKLTPGYIPLWRQTASVDGYHSQDNMEHLSVGKAGKIVYRSVRPPLSTLLKYGVTNAGSNMILLCRYDHELTLSGLQATGSYPGGNNIDFGSNRTGQGPTSGVSNVGRTICVDEDKNIALGWATLSNTFNVQGYKLICYGHKAFFPDEAERYMDTGLSENALFFMATRSQLDGQFQPVQVDNVNDLPLRSDYIPPVLGSASITSQDTTYQWLNGILAFAYYSYADPEYIAPAAEGNANLVFYNGNNSVQRVSVERAFTPALLIIANRAASVRKTVFNTFFDPRLYEQWGSTRASVVVDGLVELNEGNFKVAGRMDSINLGGSNFVALALGAVLGAHEIVSYTGTGAIQSVPHSLGVAPSFVVFQGNSTGLILGGTALGGTGTNSNQGNSTGVATSSTSQVRALGSSLIEVGTTLSGNGTQYRMHVFKSSDDWTIGNASGPGTGVLTVSLGFQPKAILFKGATGVGTAWQLLYRPTGTAGLAKSLPINAGSAVEADSAFLSFTADGFTIAQGGPGNTGSSSAFYFAIGPSTPAVAGTVQIPSAGITTEALGFVVAGSSSVVIPAAAITVTALAPTQNNVFIPAADITVEGLAPTQNNVFIPDADVAVEALAPTLSP